MDFCDLPALRRGYAGQAGQLVNEFYVPVLGQATRYDRQAGDLVSTTLVQLASGLAAFIRRVRELPPADRPAMRLITGVTWSPEDIAATSVGLKRCTPVLTAASCITLRPLRMSVFASA
jgi:hypothetical protein